MNRILKLKIALVAGIVVLVAVVVLALWWLNKDNKVELAVNDRIDLTPARLEKIRQIGQWEFLAISNEEVVDTLKRGFFGDSELVRVYYGTLRLGVNLRKANRDWLRVEGDSVVVATLPAVELLDSSFIDEARSRSFFEKGTWTDADREALYRKAYRKMMSRCLTKENFQTARENGRLQFGRFLKGMGFLRVRVDFAGEPKK